MSRVDRVTELETELEEMKLKSRMKDREFEHSFKLARAEIQLEFKKVKMDLEQHYQDKLSKLRTEHHTKIVESINRSKDEMKELCMDIISRTKLTDDFND